MNRAVLEKYQLQPKSIRYKKNVQIIEEKNRKFVAKKNNKKNKRIYQYLISRNFTNFPRVFTSPEEDIELMEYIEDISMDDAQRLEDMIYLLSILHNKTTFYKEVDLDEIKKIYEETIDEYNYLFSYYQGINSMIEEEVYMSPANYYFLLNISKVYRILNVGRKNIEDWYQAVNQKKTLRFVLNHNHLTRDHLLENEQLYFISWDHANIGYPILDLVNLFQENYEEIEISTLLSLYQSKYKLMDYEYYLFLTKICQLPRLDFNHTESIKIEEITKFIQYTDKIYLFLSKQNSSKPNNHPQQ